MMNESKMLNNRGRTEIDWYPRPRVILVVGINVSNSSSLGTEGKLSLNVTMASASSNMSQKKDGSVSSIRFVYC